MAHLLSILFFSALLVGLATFLEETWRRNRIAILAALRGTWPGPEKSRSSLASPPHAEIVHPATIRAPRAPRHAEALPG